MPTAIPHPPTLLRRSPRFLCPKPAATSKSINKARPQEKKNLTKRRTGSKGSVNSSVVPRKSSRLREETKKSVAATEPKRRCSVIGLAAVDASKKSKISECELGSSADWSKEQEAALQRAYIDAKPTPHFWRKVSRLVPGKSAQECFDKVNSELSTPPPRLQSRAKKTGPTLQEASPISASKVLNPVKTVSKRSRSDRQKQAQKTVRHLLQKQYHAEQDKEADLFSILEPNFDPSTKLFDSSPVFSTPENLCKSQSFFLKSSSLSLKKPLSRFSSSKGADLVSPPVLKNVKNWALHEKYLDQLHTRDARRNRGLGMAGKNLIKENEIRRIDAVKAAKSALICDVKNAIDQLQNLQCTTGGESSDLWDDFDVEDEEGDEEFQ